MMVRLPGTWRAMVMSTARSSDIIMNVTTRPFFLLNTFFFLPFVGCYFATLEHYYIKIILAVNGFLYNFLLFSNLTENFLYFCCV
nr:MAG TPA: hypothetical protein [Bacteriophage sp.]